MGVSRTLCIGLQPCCLSLSTSSSSSEPTGPKRPAAISRQPFRRVAGSTATIAVTWSRASPMYAGVSWCAAKPPPPRTQNSNIVRLGLHKQEHIIARTGQFVIDFLLEEHSWLAQHLCYHRLQVAVHPSR